MTSRVALTTALLLIALPGAAGAQKSKCGPTADLTGQLESLFERLTDPDSASVAFRAELGIVTPAADAPRSVVTDSRDCNRLLGATRTKLRSIYGGKENPFGDYTFGFFRIGDYYIALQLPEPSPDLVASGRVELLIFRVTDLAFVARILA